MNELCVTGLTKSYGTQRVLAGLDLVVKAGSFVAVLGPSGSGKTTLLRLIAGFERADQGSITLHDVVVDDANHFVESSRRRVGYVPQEGNLFPHLTVQANVGFGLVRRDRRGPRVEELLEMVGLTGLAERYPHELSGGQQQRVALARGLAIKPSLVLLDEPFSSLDASLRASVRHDVRRVLRDAGATTILVTHDQDEALSLSDQVAIIRDGAISQLDAPNQLYARPLSPALAREFGQANLISGVARHGCVVTHLGTLTLETTDELTRVADGTRLLVLIRPEQLVLSESTATVRARVLETEFYGHDAIVKLSMDGHEALVARTNFPTNLPPREALVGLEVRGAVVAWCD